MKHAAEGFEGVCSNTPKNDMQMFCAFRREDAPSRGLTAGFGIGPGVSPPLAIGVYSGADLAAFAVLRFDVCQYDLARTTSYCVVITRYKPQLQLMFVCRHTKKQSRKHLLPTLSLN